MYIFLSILIVIASLLLIGAVLIQKSKGGGLASNFASSNQIMGVRKTTDVVEKTTWTLAVIIMVLCIATVAFMPKAIVQSSVVEGQTKEVPTANFETESLPVEEVPATEAPATETPEN